MKSNSAFALLLLIFPFVLLSQNVNQFNAYKYVYIPTVTYTHTSPVGSNETVTDRNGNVIYNRNIQTTETTKSQTEDDYNVSSQLREYFKKKGFIVISDPASLKPNEACLLLKFDITHSWENYDIPVRQTAIVKLNIRNSQNEIVFSNEGRHTKGAKNIRDTDQDVTTKAIQDALKYIDNLNYKFDPIYTQKVAPPVGKDGLLEK